MAGSSGFERARLPSLLKNCEFGHVLKGHEFTRADNARGINAALAAEGRFALPIERKWPFSASCSAVPKQDEKNRPA
ncbi:MAG: hypothetical protein ACLGSH_07110 [Acidobacteriota bacterium]